MTAFFISSFLKISPMAFFREGPLLPHPKVLLKHCAQELPHEAFGGLP
jgi:hypothetical protein